MAAVRAGLVAGGRDDATAFRIAADENRLAPQFGMIQLLDGREEGVHVDVKDMTFIQCVLSR
jgi:hypothetical protein